MPGLRYAHGPDRISTGIPSSAFSKGHPLVFDSASSLSGVPVDFPTTALIVGVAMASSLESVDNRVPFVVAQRDTVWTASSATNSQFTPGERLDLELVTGNFRVATSANTGTVIIDTFGGSVDVRSDVSEVRVMFDADSLHYKS